MFPVLYLKDAIVFLVTPTIAHERKLHVMRFEEV